jgi:hypothetical protein
MFIKPKLLLKIIVYLSLGGAAGLFALWMTQKMTPVAKPDRISEYSISSIAFQEDQYKGLYSRRHILNMNHATEATHSVILTATATVECTVSEERSSITCNASVNSIAARASIVSDPVASMVIGKLPSYAEFQQEIIEETCSQVNPSLLEGALRENLTLTFESEDTGENYAFTLTMSPNIPLCKGSN